MTDSTDGGDRGESRVEGRSRRDVLAGLTGLCGVGLAGCSSIFGGGDTDRPGGTPSESTTDTPATETLWPTATPEPTPTATPEPTPTPTPEPLSVVYETGWEGSDTWERYVQGAGSARLAERDSPDGGSRTLLVQEEEGWGNELIVGTSESLSGWSGQWRLRGLFYARELSPSTPYQQLRVIPAYDPTVGDDYSPSMTVGFRDGDGNERPVAVRGDSLTAETTVDVNWEGQSWYRFECAHDGRGTYTASVWSDGSSKPETPAKSTGETPSAEARPLAIDVNGSPRAPFEFEFASVEYATAAESNE